MTLFRPSPEAHVDIVTKAGRAHDEMHSTSLARPRALFAAQASLTQAALA
jgi:hypothetical protein